MAKSKESDFNFDDLKSFLPSVAGEETRWGFIAMAPVVGFLLFVFMVLLVSTGDADSRIGTSHTRVPGIDGDRG